MKERPEEQALPESQRVLGKPKDSLQTVQLLTLLLSKCYFKHMQVGLCLPKDLHVTRKNPKGSSHLQNSTLKEKKNPKLRKIWKYVVQNFNQNQSTKIKLSANRKAAQGEHASQM